MRWTIKEKPPVRKPGFGDKRLISRFLILPRRIRNEVRWLEFVHISQFYAGWLHTDKWFSPWADIEFKD